MRGGADEGLIRQTRIVGHSGSARRLFDEKLTQPGRDGIFPSVPILTFAKLGLAWGTRVRWASCAAQQIARRTGYDHLEQSAGEAFAQ
jgi:hypothetical protein